MKVKILIVLITILFLCCISTLLLVLTSMIILRRNSQSSNLSSNYYLLTEITPSLNLTSLGLSKTNEKIGNEEYISYINPVTNNLVIFSNLFIEKQEYECTGSCYCNNNNNNNNNIINKRRFINTPRILNNGLTIIFSAFSAALAINLAKEAFSRKCEIEYSSICKEEVRTEVTECYTFEDDEYDYSDDIYFDEDENEEEEEEEFLIKEEKEEERERRGYQCYGHCVSNKKPVLSRMNEEGILNYQKYKDCTHLMISKKVMLDVPISNNLKNKLTKGSKSSHPFRLTNSLASHKFRKQTLIPFCKENSIFEYKRWDMGYIFKVKKNNNNLMKRYGPYKKFSPVSKASACVGNSEKLNGNYACELVKKWRYKKSI